MSFKLFLCKIGIHNWQYYQRPVNFLDDYYTKETTHSVEQRKCIHCERLEESIHGMNYHKIERRLKGKEDKE